MKVEKPKLNNTEKEEKKRRFDTVFGIYIAAFVGFVLNILADIIKDWVFGEQTFNLFQKEVIAILFLLLIVSVVFLEFFIYDFRHELSLDQKFWSRFFDYFGNKHWLSSRVTKIPKILFSIFKWCVWILFASLFFLASFPVFVVWILISIIFNLGKKQSVKKFEE